MKLLACISTAAAFVSTIATPVHHDDTTIRVRAASETPESRGTWFEPGISGACNGPFNESGLLAAIGPTRFGTGRFCNQWIRITSTSTGVTGYGQLFDECPSCGENDIDMSPNLFEQFAPLEEGVIEVEWRIEPVGFQPPNQMAESKE